MNNIGKKLISEITITIGSHEEVHIVCRNCGKLFEKDESDEWMLLVRQMANHKGDLSLCIECDPKKIDKKMDLIP